MGADRCKNVLVFNQRKKLVGILGSVYEASKITGCKPGNISRACNGDLISNGNWYFRYIDNSIEIEIEDLNTLKVDEYDEMCGVDRKLYANQNMNRKKWKYNKGNNDKTEEDEN